MRVRFMTVMAVGVAASISLSGCAVKSTLDAKLAPKPTTVTVEATVAAVGAPINGTLTKGFPDDLPMWPSAKVAKSMVTNTRQGASYSAILTTRDPFADVLAGVGEGLKQADWRVEATDASSAAQQVSILMISNTGADGIVTVSQMGAKPVAIEYVVTPKK